MYERFYGLSRTPFAVTPDPAMLFMSKVHREALATIIYGVETRKGFIVCTGEVGTGKSTIIRAFFDQIREDAVKLIYIFTPQVTPFEMARYICGELGMAEPESIFAAVPRLQLKLLEIFESGRTVVLMIDEAQLLPVETLEFLRLLSNFETDTEKLIQIVLVGQPEVDTMLARPDMRQVNQRVALRARLAGLSVEESYDYIEHRLRVCGADDLAQVLSPSSAWLIAEAAGGIPRRINILADNALIAGFGAAQRPLGSQLAGNAVREFLGKSGAAAPPRQERFAAGWRAARRLRGALAREKSEPDEWVAASPPNDGIRQGPPPSSDVIHPAQHNGARWQVTPVRPPRMAAPAAPPPPPPRPVERVEPPSSPPPVDVGSPAPPVAAPPPLEVLPMPVEPAPIFVEPVLQPILRDPSAPIDAILFVEPVAQPPRRVAPSIDDVLLIEPVVQAPVPRAAPEPIDDIIFVEPVAIFVEPAEPVAPRSMAPSLAVAIDRMIIVEPVAPSAAPVELRPQDDEEQRTEPPVLVFPAHPTARVPRSASTFGLRQTPWPALSRVRSGLQTRAPHRSVNDI